MEDNSAIIKLYRIMFILGGFIAFISCFIEWYYVEVINEEGQIVLDCSYNLYMGWKIVDRIYLGALGMFYPKSPPMAIEFLFFYLGIIVISIYIALFKGSPKLQNPQKSKYTAHFLLSSIIMSLVLISYFCFGIVFEYGMHIPVLVINDQSYEVIIHQNIGIGFVLNLVSFIFLFPLAWFQFRMNAQFEMVKDDQKSEFDAIINLNLDRLIAEELALKNSEEPFRSTEIGEDVGVFIPDYQLRRTEW
jgi:hypothetical protein